ncbi:MAG: calcium-binding protein [Pseudomonadota bacterium]
MPIIDTIFGAVNANGLQINSIDPVLDVTFEGAVVSTTGAAVQLVNEAAEYTVDMNIDGIVVSAFTSAILYRDNNGTVTVGQTGQVRAETFAIVGFSSNLSPLNLVNRGFVQSSGTAFSSGAAADLVENSGTLVGTVFLRDGADEIRNSGSIAGDIIFGDGDDIYNGRDGFVAGNIQGGAGNDTYVVDGPGDIIVEQAGAGFDEVQSFDTYTLGANIEDLNLRGSANIDGTGNDIANTFNGNAGNNVLKGKGGPDIFEASGGNDTFRGGSGIDAAFYRSQNKDMVIDLAAGTAVGKFTDTLIQIERVFGGAGDDTIGGSGARNTLSGGDGDDEISGRGGNDDVFGNAGADVLLGNGGSDFLDGGTAKDTLNGGTGNDRLLGAAGGDTFVFEGSFDDDQIIDFDVNQGGEKIDLSGVASIRNFNDLRNNHLTDDGTDSTIDDGNGNTILIAGVVESDFTAGDFIF